MTRNPARPGSQESPRPSNTTPLGQELRRHLSSTASLRQAFLLSEILGPPVALRGPGARPHGPGEG